MLRYMCNSKLTGWWLLKLPLENVELNDLFFFILANYTNLLKKIEVEDRR